MDEYPLSRSEAISLGINKYHGEPCIHDGTTLKRVKQYDCYACHKASRKAHLKAYRKTPKGAAFKKRHRDAYKERLRTQMPPWADPKAIREMYKRASELGLEVDHIIPLKGENVCGLHVENNLQLITAEENQLKGNSFLVE